MWANAHGTTIAEHIDAKRLQLVGCSEVQEDVHASTETLKERRPHFLADRAPLCPECTSPTRTHVLY